MRFNWLAAACLIAIAVMMLELDPGLGAARWFRDTSVSATAFKSALVTESSVRRGRDANQRAR